ncbi:hypothetical protein N7508_011121 [Penicillium antarcticum]|uniref:uncharacterized protein n=1 Tax=Penicillium antarcticum TaxID=416450 RepID=UPI00239FF912|nr:uncharacterized protein N7508_011121 [Penicillium antarcticum]KAJ5288346.1 hypothetical protein N7508_011121 [Penicillium antarcticum]
MEDPDYKEKFPTIPFPNKPRRPNSGKEYRRRLEESGLTRVYNPDEYRIKIRGIAVWDTTAHPSPQQSGVLTYLRQVWLCSAHYSNAGGGLPDQELANVAMAWMMHQLTSIGIAFHDDTIDKIFEQTVRYFFDHLHGSGANGSSNSEQWADKCVYDEHKPVRPWGLGEIVQPDTGFYHLAGKTTRTPGRYRRITLRLGKQLRDS